MNKNLDFFKKNYKPAREERQGAQPVMVDNNDGFFDGLPELDAA